MAWWRGLAGRLREESLVPGWPGGWLLGALLGARLWAWSAPASAVDVEVDSDLSFQLYEVRTPGAPAFLARRRFVAGLGVRLVEPLSEPDDAGRRVRLIVGARLRLDQGFAEDCLLDGSMCVRATDREARADFQPLAVDTRVDVPALTVEVTGLPLDGTVRLGRQLRVDPVGFTRFDGLSVGVRPLAFFEAEAYGGALVRGTSLGGTSQFEMQGPRMLPLGDLPAERAPFVDAARDAWLVGGAVRGGLGAPLTIGLDARYAWDARGDLLRRASLSASSAPHEALRLEAQGTLDLLDLRVIAALAAAELRLGPATVRASIDHLVPRFDPGTVWAWFGAAPVQQARLGASGRLGDDLELGGALRGRRVDRQGAEDLDAGIELYARARIEGFQLGASGFGWSGALGPVAGAAIEASRAVVRELSLEAQVSVWHFDDALDAQSYGTIVSSTLSGLWTITEQAVLVVELQHAASRTVGHRFRGMLQLRVMTWR
jgi:hypothetical protein